MNFVHAQRRRFKITRPCSPLWRPFQPGGEPLAGATLEERDNAFYAELKELKLLVATGRVDSLAAAHQSFNELSLIDLRKLRIGIPLPRWTEDAFNGEEHRSINDYLPALPRIPKVPATWYAKQDAYLQDPTDEAFFQLLEGANEETDFCHPATETGATADLCKISHS